jgi:hypothetical protein
MEKQRIINELDLLGRLIAADGYGDHYVEAVNEAVHLLQIQDLPTEEKP